MNDNIVYSVSQINNYSSELLKKKLSNVWVEGEISSMKTYPSGYTYLILKDNKCELSCITYSDKIDNICTGMAVTVNGDIGLYVIKGNYQLKIESIYPKGRGELWQSYLLLKNQLEKEGLFLNKHKIKIPFMPKNIGILSSLEGSVIHDICNILKRRSPYLNIIIKNSQVNGVAASVDLCKNLNDLILYGKVDLIIIARGGGSFEDLACFNDEKFLRKVFDSHIPIVSAIGHETDFTLCDFVSDLRASTPSEAAELIALDIIDLRRLLYNKIDKITLSINKYISKNSLIIENYSKLIKTNNILNILSNKYEKNQYLIDIVKNDILNKVERFYLKLDSSNKIIKNNNIEKIKKMGFSILRKNDKIVSNINQININDLINLELYKGTVSTQVREINEK